VCVEHFISSEAAGVAQQRLVAASDKIGDGRAFHEIGDPQREWLRAPPVVRRTAFGAIT
jgi:hypothetical protein